MTILDYFPPTVAERPNHDSVRYASYVKEIADGGDLDRAIRILEHGERMFEGQARELACWRRELERKRLDTATIPAPPF